MSAGFWIVLVWLVLLAVACELSTRERRRELWRKVMAGLVGLAVAFQDRTKGREQR